MNDPLPALEPPPVPAVVSTKLHVPRPPSGFVTRQRLVDRLDEGLARALTLVCAPPGFGKSALLAEWCQLRGTPVGWLSLDPGDNDPARFWRHVAAALDRALGDPKRSVSDAVGPLIARSAERSFDAPVTAVVNTLAEVTDDVVLVLDDYHVIEEPVLHESVRFLLEHAPPVLHVALVTRADPPLSLARARSRGELTELRETELRFTAQEAATLLNEATGAVLPDDAARILTDRTEGWAAGLQLAGLSLRGSSDVASFVATFSGSHRFVLDYLTEEVLHRQPPAVRDFLVETSILEQLSGPLCDAVTGRTDSQAQLEAAERANLFLVPLDEVRGWWRYHHLFADLLRVRLRQQPEERVRELHFRAATWHEAHGRTDQAIHHALNADRPGWAAGVIERHADELLLRSEGATLQRWFTELPADLHGSRRLLLARARVALYGGRITDAEALLDAADRTVVAEREAPFEPSIERSASPLSDLDPMAALLRAFVAHMRGDPDTAETLATRTLAELGDDRSVLAIIARLHLAAAPWLRGDVRRAESAVSANVDEWRASQEHARAAWSASYLGQIQQSRGDLDAACATYEEVFDLDASHTGPDSPAAGIAHVGMAQVAYRRDDIEGAIRHARDGIARCRQFVDTQALAIGLTTLARSHLAENDPVAADEAIAEAARVGPGTDVVDLLNPIPSCRARLLLDSGDLEGAVEWAERRGLIPGDRAGHAVEPAHLLLARILVAQGRPDEALRTLEPLRESAVADGRLGDLIEIETLRARALTATGAHGAAMRAAADAVTLAAPQRHIRVFVDEGPEMATVLGRLISMPAGESPFADDPPLEFLRRLIDAFGDADRRDESGGKRTLVVPLTERELEVLGLMATGRPNKEIAAELYVSLNTIKKHVTHIFEKLGVSNRTAATDRARQLGLLT